MKHFLIFLFIACFLNNLSPALAGDVAVTRYFSGLWEQSRQESQGLVLQIIDQEENGMPKAVAYWFTYGDDAQSAWHMAIGHVEGNRVLMMLYTSFDVDFMQDASDAVNPVDVTGQLDLTFDNCNKGTAEYTLGDDSGSFEIRRLAGLYNGRCTGGISDNTPGGARPLILDVALIPPGDDGDAKGKARFWERPDRSDFHVSAENLADGEYEIYVCGQSVGPLTVLNGEGATQFRSPEANGKLNLTFMPRNCPIEIRQSSIVFLTSGDAVLAEKEKGPKDDGDPDDDEQLSVTIQFDNTGAEGFENAEGEAGFENEPDERNFEVEIEDVPKGSYRLFVGGSEEGSIDVNASGKGKLKFSDPQKGNRELLGFDPSGQIIEVRNSDNVTILEVAFPDT